jgi:fructuronate reductase
VESFDFEIIEKIYKPFDNLSMLVTLNNNGKTKYEISAAIADALTTQAND